MSQKAMLFTAGGVGLVFFWLFLVRITAEYFFQLNVSKERFLFDLSDEARESDNSKEEESNTKTYIVWDHYGNTFNIPLEEDEVSNKDYLGSKIDVFNLYVFFRIVYTLLSILPWSRNKYAKNIHQILVQNYKLHT